MDTLASLGVAAFTGFVTGGLGSLVAPWATWGVEKQRQRLAKRQKLMDRARLWTGYPPCATGEFRRHEMYPMLRPYLDSALVASIEGAPDASQRDDENTVDAEFKDALLRDIARIEREWKLV